jgi:hypothetical protein
MPLIGFTVFKEELLAGKKCQTIRRPRKLPLKVGDKLHVYWHPRQKDCEKLGETTITSIVRKKASELTNEDALKDGFRTGKKLVFGYPPDALDSLLRWLLHTYPKMEDDWQFDVITFEPIRKEASQ